MSTIDDFTDLMHGFNRAIVERFETEATYYLNYLRGVADEWSEFFATSIQGALQPIKYPESSTSRGWKIEFTTTLLSPPQNYRTELRIPFSSATYDNLGERQWFVFDPLSKPVLSTITGFGSDFYLGSLSVLFDRRLFTPHSVDIIYKLWTERGLAILGPAPVLSYNMPIITLHATADYTLDALIYLAENGVVADFIDYDKLSQFLIYLHAYEKYKTQITAELAAMQARARKDTQEFAQKIKIATNQQYVYLSGLASQMSQSIQAEARAQKVALESAKNSLNSYALQLRGLCG